MSYLSNNRCEQCGSEEAITDIDCRSHESYTACPQCGHEESSRLIEVGGQLEWRHEIIRQGAVRGEEKTQ